MSKLKQWAQWVNETCRDLQAKVIKTAAFCHNRALQDLYPDNYRLLFSTGFLALAASPLSSDPDVLRVQRVRTEGKKPTRACGVLVCKHTFKLHYNRLIIILENEY
jgi:hypothetical protein